MKRTLIIAVILCFGLVGVSAQKRDATTDEKETRTRFSTDWKELQRELLETRRSGSVNTDAVTVADVGEPDSFGKNAKFLGVANTGAVYVYYSCDPTVLLNDLGATLGPDDRCLAAPNPGQSVTATFNDVGRITIPAKSVDNTIYFIQNNVVIYDLQNPNANRVNANLLFAPSYTIESDALNDPAAIDPFTGLPMNGTFTTGVNASKTFFRPMEANTFESIQERYSTAATRGFARSYFADLGLPQSVINRIYSRPMTIRLNLRVRANFVSTGFFAYSVRFLGN